MNLQNYRSSFTVFVADSQLERGSELANSLSQAGYACEHRLSLTSFKKEILVNPPHIVLLQYDDAHFFDSYEKHQEFIDELQAALPSVRIIFLAEQKSFAQACELYEFGIYDCQVWPPVHNLQVLRSVDRAAEQDYYRFLNEQLSEKLSGVVIPPDENFAMFEVWMKEVESLNSKEQMIASFLREGTRLLASSEALYMRYIDDKKTLVYSQSRGFGQNDLSDIGLDLGHEEPGFVAKMLKQPEKLISLHDFVIKGLRRTEALYLPLEFQGKTLGVFIFPAGVGQVISNQQKESGYLKSAMLMLQRQLSLIKLKERLQKFSVYDDASEALNAQYIQRKVFEEVSRARRIVQPVSLLLIGIDGYNDLTLSQSQDSLDKLLKSFTEVLNKNSRLNDIVGRIDNDQFVVCLPHTDQQGAIIKSERLRRMVETADFTAVLGARSKVTVSIGLSEYPSVCHDAGDLFKSAESALLEVRKVGGNRICPAVASGRFTPDFVVRDEKGLPTHRG